MNEPLDSPSIAGADASLTRTQTLLAPRLSLMMFLQYAVWGAWLPILGRYLSGHLGFDSGQIGWIAGTAGAVGALFAPFIAGQIADRYFSAERFMCFAQLAGGAVLFVLAGQTSYTAWLALSVLYSLIYMPTIAISNSLAFAHLRDPDRQFPPIRLWGTIGWIAVSWVFPMVWLQVDLQLQLLPPFLTGRELTNVLPRLADALRLAGILSFAYGLLSLFLPHTPPKKSVEPLAFAKAFGLWRHRGLLVLTLAALPIAVIHTIYFIQTPQFLPTLPGVRDADIQPAMTIGQFSEIFVLAGLGTFLKRLGFRAVLTTGCLAYAARFAIFGLGAPTWLVVTSQAFHGVCFACFYATAFIYVERCAPADVRHSAQTTFGIILLGLGPLTAGPVLTRLAPLVTRQATIAECRQTPNLVPQLPAAGERDTDGWSGLYPGASDDLAAYRAVHPEDQARVWRGLQGETVVTAFDYRQFWWIVGGAGLFSSLLIALLYRNDTRASGARDG